MAKKKRRDRDRVGDLLSLVGRLTEQLAQERDEGRRREHELLTKLVEQAGRPPVVIDSSEAIRSIGESIARITQGPPEAVLEGTRLKQDVANRWAEAMGGADPGLGVDFRPFAEIDDWMNPDRARDQTQPHPDIRPVADAVFAPAASPARNGHRPLRTDGRPVEFVSGESGEPPSGGWED